MKKILLLVVLALITAVIVTGCKKNNNKEAGVIIVGTNAEFRPFEYMEKNEIKGFDVDLINEIGKLTGKKFQFKHMAFDSLLAAMMSGKIDMIVSGMTATDERRKNVDFSDPYFNAVQSIIVKEGSDIKTFNDLKGKRIGVVLGYTGDIAVTEKYGKDANITRYAGTGEAIISLISNKIDVAVLDNAPAKSYAEKNKGLVVLDTDLAVEQYSIAMPKGSTELVKEINSALKTLKENGTYYKLLEKYFK